MRKPLFLRTALLTLVVAALALGRPGAARAADEGAQPWLGVYMQTLDESMRDALHYSGDGVLINRLVSGGPAERAGIRRGDLIVRFDGRTVRSPDDLRDMVSDRRVGDGVDVTVVRDGRERTIRVTLSDRGEGDVTRRMRDDESDDDDSIAPVPPVPPRAPRAPRAPLIMDRQWVDDLRRQTLSAEMSDYFGGTARRGVLVLEVMDDTPAKRAGMRGGDVITHINGERVETVDELVSALREAEGVVKVDIVRHNARMTLEPRLDRTPAARARTYRWESMPDGNRRIIIRGDSSNDRDELRQQIQELRDEIRRLKEERREDNRDRR
jgi:C-terminal processing protease CtpA/Prc